jgi:hypothetical protein
MREVSMKIEINNLRFMQMGNISHCLEGGGGIIF